MMMLSIEDIDRLKNITELWDNGLISAETAVEMITEIAREYEE